MTILDHGPDGATARFSECCQYRYTLRRVLRDGNWRVVWLMLNPSTADAFKLDPTVTRCVEWTRRWGADVCEVVNLFALRSPYPTDLFAQADANRERTWKALGADVVNDVHIREACSEAKLVITAWGNHGDDRRLHWRGAYVLELLRADGVKNLRHLGRSQSGSPLHPLARGKSFIPYEREPVRWDTVEAA